jgi:hypothetical protein
VPKKSRIARTRADLIRELADQVVLLAHACNSFDNGLVQAAKHMAVSLRVLLHERGQCRALLQQLGIREKRFLNTSRLLNPKNLLTENTLCIFNAGGWVPRCNGPQGHGPDQTWIRFEDWWNQDVVRDNQRRTFNRRELVMNVADTDGGAHADPDLDAAYMDLSRNNSLGWVFDTDKGPVPFEGPQSYCIRQIAHEVLETIKAKATDINVPYRI